MNKKIIEQLSELQKRKQERAQLHLEKLQQQELELINSIKQKDYEIEALRNESINFKAISYGNLAGCVINRLEIRKIEFKLTQYVVDIEKTRFQQRKLVKELDDLKKEIIKAKEELRKYIIKIEKYDYCKTII